MGNKLKNSTHTGCSAFRWPVQRVRRFHCPAPRKWSIGPRHPCPWAQSRGSRLWHQMPFRKCRRWPKHCISLPSRMRAVHKIQYLPEGKEFQWFEKKNTLWGHVYLLRNSVTCTDSKLISSQSFEIFIDLCLLRKFHFWPYLISFAKKRMSAIVCDKPIRFMC